MSLSKNASTLVVIVLLLGLATACNENGPVASDTEELLSPLSMGTNIERPLKSSSFGTGELIQPGAPGSAQRCNDLGLFTLITSGTGNGTFLGKFTFTSTNCTPFPIPGPLAFTQGTGVLTSANGYDKLFITYFGQQEQVNQDLVARFTIEQEITGGEGRFKGASGEVSGAGIVNFANGTSSSEVTGYVIFDASNRALQ